jgi:hypothetical protein
MRMIEILLMGHVFFGVVCVLAAVWLFVETLNAGEGNLKRIRAASWAAAVSMWLAFLIGGYWYVTFYKADKALILKGPWPFAHNFFMETKEHLVIMLVLAATYLPIVAANPLPAAKGARRLLLWMSAIVVLLALLSEGHGAIIAMGVKAALLAQPH